MKRASAIILLLACFGIAGPDAVSAPAAPAQSSATATGHTYASAEEAVAALIDALRADKPDALRSVLGPGSEKLLSSGDKYSDAADARCASKTKHAGYAPP
jgi:hypothetical protein